VQQCAVPGNRVQLQISQALVGVNVLKLPEQLFNDWLQGCRIKDAAGFGEAAQAEAFEPEAFLDDAELTDLLQPAQTVDDGSEEVKQEVGYVLVIVQFAVVAVVVTVQRFEQFDDVGDVFGATYLLARDGLFFLRPSCFAGSVAMTLS